jgi:tetratricopeptide (TPR) repeat protein
VAHAALAPDRDSEALARFRLALELADGFAFHVIVAESRDDALQAVAGAVGGDCVVATPGPQREGEASGRFATRILADFEAAMREAEGKGRPVLLNLAARSGKEQDALREVYRRLNEHRNGIVRRLKTPLLLAIGPEQERAFSHEAPDLNAIRGSGLRLREPGRRAAEMTTLEAGDHHPRLEPEPAAVLADRLAAAREGGAAPRDLALLEGRLGRALRNEGREEEALGHFEVAVSFFRGAGPTAGEALAGSLNDLGIALAAVGRREEALAAAEEAVQLYRDLAAARPDAFRPDLALSLANLGSRLDAVGRREAALAATEEAMRLLRELAGAVPDAFRPDLARSLNNLGIALAAVGRRDEALAATEEAVGLYRELATARPDAFRPDLALSLANLGAMVAAVGRREAALAAAEEAAGLYRELATARPDAFRRDLAASLSNLANGLKAVGRREEALAAAEEAVGLYRDLAAARPDAFRPDLAQSLMVLAFARAAVDPAGAFEAAREAVALYTPLVRRYPEAFGAQFQLALRWAGEWAAAAGREAEGDPVFREARAAAREAGLEE